MVVTEYQAALLLALILIALGLIVLAVQVNTLIKTKEDFKDTLDCVKKESTRTFNMAKIAVDQIDKITEKIGV